MSETAPDPPVGPGRRILYDVVCELLHTGTWGQSSLLWGLGFGAWALGLRSDCRAQGMHCRLSGLSLEKEEAIMTISPCPVSGLNCCMQEKQKLVLRRLETA